MAIARLKKVVILGESTSKKAILEALQESALLHLIPLNDVKDQISTLSYENLKDALHYLKTSPQKRRLQTPRNLDNIENRIDEILLNKRNRFS